jgi:diguanylate cyclase (GGDEF)-like protein
LSKKVNSLARSRIVMAVAAALWLAHVAVVALLGTRPPGPLLSDILQFVLGVALIYSISLASGRSEGLARSFWRLATVAYVAWLVAQGFSVYFHFYPSDILSWASNLLFSFWFAPLAMALFLDPERETGRLDALMALDFLQGVLVCIAAYVYFFYLPHAEAPGELSHEVWTPYFAGYGAVALSFILRGLTTHSRDARALFRRFGVFLTISGSIDALYYYGPGRGLQAGAWFDLLWSALLLVPAALAATWKQADSPEQQLESQKRGKRIYTELSYLLFPLLVLFMSLRIARERLGLAALVLLTSFVCSSARLLVTQHRLVLLQQALRREAARDGLTGLWNRKAIFEILERELLRAERVQEPLGLIMIDVDHFKIINDSRGHAAGDLVLRIIASSIAAVVRPYDSVGRYGGEEFLIVAPGCSLAQACELAERIRSHVAGCSIMAGGSSVHVSLSLGVTTGRAAGEMEKLLQDADAALYKAKNAGRNRVAPSLERAATASQAATTSKSDFWL